MSNSLINVAIPVPMRQLFSYILPGDMLVSIGARVVAPFGNRQLVGIVVEINVESQVDLKKLKPIISVLDQEPLFDKTSFTFLTQCADYYHYPLGEVFSQALPALLRQIQAVPEQSIEMWRKKNDVTDTEKDNKNKIKPSAKKQLSLYQLFQRRNALSWPEIRTAGFLKSQLNALIKLSLVEVFQQSPDLFSWQDSLINEEDKFELSQGQAITTAAISGQLEQFSCHLLFGITGSGKTEIYLQLIEKVLATGKQILVLVPEIGLTPQTLTRFENRFNVPIFLHHSGLNDSERLQTWLASKRNSAAITIGTRSAVTIPFADLGLIIVDEEHDASLKQQDGYRYHARDLAILKAKQLNIPIVLGSATPSLESLHNALSGRYQLHKLTTRPGQSQQADVELVNLQLQPSNFGMAQQTQQAIKQTLKKGEQVLLFLNRRGYAPALACQECHWISTCLRCNKSYTLHFHDQQLICHHCNSQKRVPKQCPTCGSVRLKPLGLGTEQLEEKLADLFPNVSTIRIDRDSTRKKGELANKLQQIGDNKHQLLIGTQMLAKGHHFPNVTLVVILDIDGALFSYDFRAAEHMAQLLVQVAGRAGRAEKKGTVLVQTNYPDHPLLINLVQHGYSVFAQQALQERKAANLPPYGYLALIRAEATHSHLPLQFLQHLALNDFIDCKLAGPMPAAVEKKAGKFRYHLLIKSHKRNAIHHAVTQIEKMLDEHPLKNKVRASIDIDPIELSW